VVHRGLHSLLEESSDQSLLWSIFLDGGVADAYLEPGHPVVLRLAQPLFKYANVAFRTKYIFDPRPNHMGSVPCDKIDQFVVTFHRE
jgi:hypothetical protein